ncbi:hypothetical protein IWW37_000625 [Coemansia sp. RSA 2050]|nr:hypothetical protein IWW37_000625 [Coemansia sp. RSA 2050]KAJ2732233.1 hypothetical protein IW152_003953 [Coemansia sp. BCRC 34962]
MLLVRQLGIQGTLPRRRMPILAVEWGRSSLSYKLRILEVHDDNGSYPVQIKETNTWRIDQVQKLIELVTANRSEFNVIDWRKVSDQFPDRTTRACQSKYKLVMRDISAASGHGKSLQTRVKGGAYDVFSNESAGWTAEEDGVLLALFEVWGTKWDKISENIGRYTASQCQGRYYWIKKRKAAKPTASNATRTKGSRCLRERPKVERPKPPPGSATKRAHWSEAEDRRLRDLLKKHGRFDRNEASKLFPDFYLAHVYYELDKALTRPQHVSGTWTRSEHQALLDLIEKHGRDWRSISLAMPTNRSAYQCRLHYAYCCSRAVTKYRKWTADEEERLSLLVDLSRQGKLEPSVAKQPDKDPPGLPGIKNLSSTAGLSRFSAALKKDSVIPEPPATPAKNENSPISWPLVSLYMMTHTTAQCYGKWARMTRSSRNQECFRGPWTREEDARLYELCQQAPSRWSWIMLRLVRPRGLAAAKIRYSTYISRYVDMLRKCRGAEWHPMADGFEEVHMRCEVLAWSRRRLEGYRPHDPYSRPHDMDLTGISHSSAPAHSKTV